VRVAEKSRRTVLVRTLAMPFMAMGFCIHVCMGFWVVCLIVTHAVLPVLFFCLPLAWLLASVL
jgi:cytochrome b subunit of formate dehydrogenase